MTIARFHQISLQSRCVRRAFLCEKPPCSFLGLLNAARVNSLNHLAQPEKGINLLIPGHHLLGRQLRYRRQGLPATL